MSITHLTSTAQLDKILSASESKLSVIDFHATWCGPCHAIAPTFEALSKQYPNVNFLKCDVDAAKEVASRYQVRAMPTFIFLKGNAEVDQIRGADKARLEGAVRRHSSGSSTGAFAGKGQTLGGGSATPPAIGLNMPAGIVNLDPQVKTLLAFAIAYAFVWYFSK